MTQNQVWVRQISIFFWLNPKLFGMFIFKSPLFTILHSIQFLHLFQPQRALHFQPICRVHHSLKAWKGLGTISTGFNAGKIWFWSYKMHRLMLQKSHWKTTEIKASWRCLSVCSVLKKCLFGNPATQRIHVWQSMVMDFLVLVKRCWM